jgi:hypothetical protein
MLSLALTTRCMNGIAATHESVLDLFARVNVRVLSDRYESDTALHRIIGDAGT